MQIGMIGLGRMGANMVRRLMRGGHAAVAYDRDAAAVEALAAEGATAAASIDALAATLDPPRAVWIMVPAGAPTAQTVEALAPRLDAGDIVIDGGNSHFKEDVRRAEALKPRGIHYVDVGTSGGVWGLERGYCLMIGGPDEAVRRLDPIFRTLVPGDEGVERTPGRRGPAAGAELGYLHCGPVGSGHFVKMVHNGIEYGLMQAFAEGFEILRAARLERVAEPYRYALDLGEIAELWRRGSVVSSWLLDLTAQALHEEPDLASYTGYVDDSGEGRWTIETAIEEAVPADVLAASLFARFRSRQERNFGNQLLSAMREKFGGHREGRGVRGKGARG